MNESVKFSEKPNRGTLISLVLYFLAFIILYQNLSRGLPYLYLEDETHHINRTLEMAKTGDLNPHYFHKPSLHFYMRLPFAYASGVNLKEVRTRDPYGLGGYAFTASHPGLVKWIRFPSLLLSAGIVLLASLLCARLGGENLAQIFTALLILCSPEFIKNSTLVGVDILMAFFCLLVPLLSLSLLENYSRKKMMLVAFICGLAVSSKYNGAPIIVVPIIVLLLQKRFLSDLIFLAIFSLVGFFAGSPYIIIEFPLFLEHLSYEGWHYAIAGHVGHEAAPGLEQALFYFRWLVTEGVGWLGTLLAILGTVFLLRSQKRAAIVLLAFPFFYALLMISQRANFTRNMVVMIPFVAVLASIVLSHIKYSSLQVAIATLAIIQPLSMLDNFPIHDSRLELERIARQISTEKKDLAISGELQMPIQLFSLPGVDALDPKRTTPQELFLSGYDLVALRRSEVPSALLNSPTQIIPGVPEDQRIPKSPEIHLLKYDPSILHNLDLPTLPLEFNELPSTEGHIWLTKRKTKVSFASAGNNSKTVVLEAMSPWPKQTISINGVKKELTTPGEFIELDFPLTFEQNHVSDVYIGEVHSPAAQGLSSDTRRLGIAIKKVSIR